MGRNGLKTEKQASSAICHGAKSGRTDQSSWQPHVSKELVGTTFPGPHAMAVINYNSMYPYATNCRLHGWSSYAYANSITHIRALIL
jgi:hypothetical protein